MRPSGGYSEDVAGVFPMMPGCTHSSATLRNNILMESNSSLENATITICLVVFKDILKK
jgi:hypothetical protein